MAKKIRAMIIEFQKDHLKYKKGDRVDMLRSFARELIESGIAIHRDDIPSLDTIVKEEVKETETQHIVVNNYYYENEPAPEKLGLLKRILQKFKIA